MSLGQHIVLFLDFYGPTSVGVLDLVFHFPNPQVLLQTIEHLVRERVVTPVKAIRHGAMLRPIPAIALVEQTQ